MDFAEDWGFAYSIPWAQILPNFRGKYKYESVPLQNILSIFNPPKLGVT